MLFLNSFSNSYYNSRLNDKSKKESYIVFIQVKLIKFLVQYIYLIYVRLIVHATQVLVYPKGYVYYMPLIYNMISLF